MGSLPASSQKFIAPGTGAPRTDQELRRDEGCAVAEGKVQLPIRPPGVMADTRQASPQTPGGGASQFLKSTWRNNFDG